jgi:hypothetical protein
MTLFDVRPALRFASMMTRYGIGDKPYLGPNPPGGALISYYLKGKPDEKTKFKLEILDAGGKLLSEIKNAPKEKGLNRAVWNTRYEGAKPRRPPTEEQMQFFGGAVGPQVLPGTYTVRLTLGDKSQEKKVEVKVDPTVNVTPADLQAQFDMAMKLRDMQSSVNEGLKTLDSIKSQLEQIEKLVKEQMPDAPAEFTKAIADYKKQTDDLIKSLAFDGSDGGLSGGAKIADQLQGLFFTIAGGNFAPTPAQRDYFGELQTEFPTRMKEVNQFLSETVPKMNETLKKYNAPTLITGKLIDLPQ